MTAVSLSFPDTIIAPASAPGRAGVAVVRVSGPRAGAVLEALGVTPLPPARQAVYTAFRDPQTGERLDRGLVLWFPAPHSFTGEDVVELQVHGSPAVVSALLEAACRVEGVRPAEAGEFTRRAFLNGKLDLAQVEGLADLIDAETTAQRRQALRQMEGELSQRYDGWREEVIRLLAWAEAYIDFPDEDIPPELIAGVEATLTELKHTFTAHLNDDARGRQVREGVYVAILGAPNAGKSSLLNWLSRRDVAIVSPVSGTTRDVVETRLDIAGHLVTLADTAGIRETEDAVEAEGIRRSERAGAGADLVLALFDAADADPAAQQTMAARLPEGRAIVVFNKCDLVVPAPDPTCAAFPQAVISLKTGEGLEGLLALLETRIRESVDVGTSGDMPAITRLRHRQALKAALTHLEACDFTRPVELACEDLRAAANALAAVTGAIHVEDLLDRIFHDFCIGK